MRTSLLSGGVNQIDTANFYRHHRAEQVTGRALRTLFNKFGMARDEVFICSKQGFTVDNSLEDAPASLVLEELLTNTDLTREDFFIFDDEKTLYSFHPTFLAYSLE